MQNKKQQIELFNQQLLSYKVARFDNLKGMELYKDQVIMIINKSLAPLVSPYNDILITSAMINNYVKNEIIPSPKGKKYTRRHLCYLITVCFLKQVLSMSEIKQIITQQTLIGDEKVMYNRFCDELENALCQCVNRDKDNKSFDANESNWSLLYAIKAVANKIYSQKMIEIFNM